MKKTDVFLLLFLSFSLVQTVVSQTNIVRDHAHVDNMITGCGNTINISKTILPKSLDYQNLLSDSVLQKKHLDEMNTLLDKVAGNAELIESVRALRDTAASKYNSAVKLLTDFKNDVLRLAGTFAQIPLNSQRLKDAKALFDDGKIREADARLQRVEMEKETVALLERDKRQKELMAETDSLLKVKANEWLIKAQVTRTRYSFLGWFDSTTYYFQRSLQCRQMGENLSEYANFLLDHKQADSATVFFGLAGERFLYQKDTASWLHLAPSLGLSYLSKSDYDHSESILMKALGILKHWSKINSSQYQHDLARIHNSLGQLYYSRATSFSSNHGLLLIIAKDFDRAEAAFLEANKGFSRLSEVHPSESDYVYHLAQIQIGLGNLYYAKEDTVRAEKAYSEALEIYKYVIKPYVSSKSTIPIQYLRDIAEVRILLGYIYLEKQDFDRAETYFAGPLNTYQLLAKVNPLEYELELANVQYRLGQLYHDKNEFSKAEAVFVKSLEIRERWALKDPVKYEGGRILLISELIEVYKNWVESIATQSEKVTPQVKQCMLYERLSRKYADDELVKEGFSEALGNLAKYNLYAKKYIQAQSAAEKSLLLDPTQNWVHINLGHCYLLRGDWDKARQIYQECLSRQEDKKEVKKALRNDWENLEAAGITCPEMAKARAWVK